MADTMQFDLVSPERSLVSVPVREVRLPTPATRSGGRSKEFFTIEMQLDPAVYGLTRTVGGAA